MGLEPQVAAFFLEPRINSSHEEALAHVGRVPLHERFHSQELLGLGLFEFLKGIYHKQICLELLSALNQVNKARILGILGPRGVLCF